MYYYFHHVIKSTPDSLSIFGFCHMRTSHLLIFAIFLL